MSKLSPHLIDTLAKQAKWFTLTRVTVRVSPRLGGYLVDVEGRIPDVLDEMSKAGELGDIVAVSGLAHSPGSSWKVAFRVDETGSHVAANAPENAVHAIQPLLSDAIKSQ